MGVSIGVAGVGYLSQVKVVMVNNVVGLRVLAVLGVADVGYLSQVKVVMVDNVVGFQVNVVLALQINEVFVSCPV